MTVEELEELARYPAFPKTASDLIRVAGTSAAAALISAWPGQEWPVPVRVGGGNNNGAVRYAQLLEIVGANAAQRIIDWAGGGLLIVPNLKAVIAQRDHDQIRARYDVLIIQGYSSRDAVFDIGIAYGIAQRTVEKIIKRPDCELKQAQGCLF